MAQFFRGFRVEIRPSIANLGTNVLFFGGLGVAGNFGEGSGDHRNTRGFVGSDNKMNIRGVYSVVDGCQ